MKFLLLGILTMFAFPVNCQTTHTIDSVVSHYPHRFSNVEKLSARINKDFHTDFEKTRAIYYWIGHRIAYDVKKWKKIR